MKKFKLPFLLTLSILTRQTQADWKVVPTLVKRGASIGSGAILLCGITIGENAVVGAGAVVTKDTPSKKIVMGAPAKVLKGVPEDQLLENQ